MPTTDSHAPKRPASVARADGATTGAGTGVPASPFNTLKLEFAVLLVLGVLVWVGVEAWVARPGVQLLVLAGYGVLGLAWLVLRTRRLSRQLARQARPAARG